MTETLPFLTSRGTRAPASVDLETTVTRHLDETSAALKQSARKQTATMPLGERDGAVGAPATASTCRRARVWYYGMTPGGELTPGTLAAWGIPVLELTESCIHIDPHRPPASLDLLYRDELRLGKVFGREAQAEALVAGWRPRVAAVRKQLEGSPRRAFAGGGKDLILYINCADFRS